MRLTLATSSGLPFLVLAFHVLTGTIALVAGTMAMAVRKGGPWHRRSGIVFVYSMIAMGLSAVAVSVYAGKAEVAGGAVAAYLIFTGWTAIRPLAAGQRRVDITLMLLAAVFAIGGFALAFEALSRQDNRLEGVPAGMRFFLSSVVLLAVIGDARLVHAGGVQGVRRIARHFWRMCFGLFIATGSFVAQLTRMTFMPQWTRSVPVILVLSAGPLLVLLYWMWRVRVRRNLNRLMIGGGRFPTLAPMPVRSPAP